MRNKVYIYIDDMRQPLIPDAIWVKNYDEAIAELSLVPYHNLTVDFDHDLGQGKTGYDIAKWLVEYNIKGNFRVHSMNPVGRNNIRQLLLKAGWKEVF